MTISAKRNKKASKRFFKKVLNSNQNQIPRVITVDKNLAYPPAIDELKDKKYSNYSAYTKQHQSLSSLNFNERIT